VARVAPTLDEAADRARRIADDVLFPAAQDTDRANLVPRERFDALAEAGLFGLQGPPAVDGALGADHASARPVLEAIAGGCGATSFVWAQHHGAVRRLAAGDGPARSTWLRRLCDGSTLAGIGFAYLRRPGPPAVRATRRSDGWVLEGTAPWITGWGLIDALVLMARADDGSVVTVVVERPAESRALRAGAPQRLAVMGATGTVELRIEALEVSEADVVSVLSDDAWRRRDGLGSSMPAPAPLGIADRAIRTMGAHAAAPAVSGTADALGRELDERRARADAVAREVAASASGVETDVAAAIATGAAERDRGLDLARRATDALVAASGGGAMSLDHPAQRLSREATFFLIQAQTRELRAASLARSVRAR
jgi:alkylation response protein AidB-like acyl-CoA dehydrogenase